MLVYRSKRLLTAVIYECFYFFSCNRKKYITYPAIKKYTRYMCIEWAAHTLTTLCGRQLAVWYSAIDRSFIICELMSDILLHFLIAGVADEDTNWTAIYFIIFIIWEK